MRRGLASDKAVALSLAVPWALSPQEFLLWGSKCFHPGGTKAVPPAGTAPPGCLTRKTSLLWAPPLFLPWPQRASRHPLSLGDWVSFSFPLLRTSSLL